MTLSPPQGVPMWRVDCTTTRYTITQWRAFYDDEAAANAYCAYVLSSGRTQAAVVPITVDLGPCAYVATIEPELWADDTPKPAQPATVPAANGPAGARLYAGAVSATVALYRACGRPA